MTEVYFRLIYPGLLTALMWISILMKADGKQARKSAGKCQLYTGASCKQYLHGKYVFIKSRSSQAILEATISKWFQTAQTMTGVSEKCWPHAKALICFHKFPICDDVKKSPSNRRFCQDECKFLEQHVCRQEFIVAKNINAVKQFVPSCGTLPRLGSDAHSNCLKLPSLDESMFPRKLTVADARNVTYFVKERASLKCHFKGYNTVGRSDDIRVFWYRNKTLLNLNVRRFRIKKRRKGHLRFISTLVIKYVTFKDAGTYECVATRGKTTVRSSVFLLVTKNHKKQGKSKGHKPPDEDSIERKKNNFDPYEGTLGRCVPYKGDACAKYLKRKESNSVFEYSYSPQSLVEKQLVREFKRIKKSNQFSERCLEMSLAIMCFNVFNTCNKSAFTPASRLCQEDCQLFDKVFCKYEVEMARKHSSAFEFLPDCTLLPAKNQLCEPMKDIVFGTPGGKINGTECYKGVGKDYDGKVNVSRTGRPCRPWVDHSPVYKFTHNYCRNFGGENYAPWCFIVNGEKEFCDIPRCDKTNNGNSVETLDTSCYSARGEDYRGQVKVSQSGQPCLQWNTVGSYESRHSYCRNYEGNREAPWCFINKDKMEYCDIPKCLRSGNSVETLDTTCYTKSGKDYRGQVKLSHSGKPCLQWNTVGSYEARHSYCRNYGGNKEAPWCFIRKDKMEYCDIPKCRHAGTSLVTLGTNCYRESGEDYRGQVKISQSGKPCLQWNTVGSYEARHSYCRNYGGKRKAPWCFIRKDKMEYCNIPKCLRAAKVADENNLLVYYVVPVAIALSVLLLFVLILLVYLKQHRKGMPSRSAPEQEPADDTVVVTTVSINKEDIGSPRVPGPMDKQVPEVNNCSVNFLDIIGKGFFMELWKAELIEADQSVKSLLVKRLSADATKGLVNTFNLEISNVRGLDHPNIAELLCVSSDGAAPFLGYAGDSERDLKTCLSQSKFDTGSNSRFMCVDYDILIDMAVQICNGIDYLHKSNIVHKDLGTRSCLIDNDGIIKIAHFGIGLYLHPGDYYHDNYMTWPVRWMSPETLQTKKFTKGNDVWSIGVLFWELFSHADRPYGDVTDKEAMNLISEGQFLSCPDDCPASLYSLMKDCWTLDPEDRIQLGLVLAKLNSWNGTVC